MLKDGDAGVLKEGQSIELKREYTEDIKKTVIAFANTAGGSIYIGIDDRGQVFGVADSDDVILRVSASIRDSIKPDLTLFVDYRVEMMNDKSVVVVEVQKGASSPYYLAGKGIRPEGVFVRQGPSTVPASDSAIFNMVRETDGDQYEKLRSFNQNLTFRDASAVFEEHNIPFGDKQMISLGIKNREGIYTNLGLLLSDQCRHTIKAAVYAGLQKEEFQDRREFSGSLLLQLKESFEFIAVHNRVRSRFEGLQRIDEYDYPAEAIREALLNALVHREYAFSSSTLIAMFEDRIEFVSVGGLVKGITFDDIMLGISIARNEKLANAFYRLGLIESYGTGIPKILRAYQNSQVQPRIETTDNAFKIVLPNSSIQKEAPRSAQQDDMNHHVQMVLDLLADHPSITRKDVDEHLGISQSTSSRLLKAMMDNGLIKSLGRGKATKYERM